MSDVDGYPAGSGDQYGTKENDTEQDLCCSRCSNVLYELSLDQDRNDREKNDLDDDRPVNRVHFLIS